MLWPLGISLGVCSVVVFALYVSAPEVQVRYGAPLLLWFVAVALVYWLGRRLVIAAMIMATLAAYFVGLK